MSGFHESLDAALGRAGERDVEALVKVIAQVLHGDGNTRYYDCIGLPMVAAKGYAAEVLASDWLAQRIEQAKAEAWDEGYRAGAEDETGAYWGTGSDTGTTNPYRGGDSHA